MSDLLEDIISNSVNWVVTKKEEIVRKLIGEDCFRYPMNLIEQRGLNSRETYLIPLDTRMLYIEFINDFNWEFKNDKYTHGIEIKHEWTYI